MSEVIAQVDLDSDWKPNDDGLEHDRFAESLLQKAANVGSGTSIAVQGPWGRGKTDLLARAAMLLKSKMVKGLAPDPVWINPWQYKSPELLMPIIAALASRLTQEKKADESIARRLIPIIRSLLTAGIEISTKASGLPSPVSELTKSLVNHGVDLIMQRGDYQPAKGKDPACDPVISMGLNFRKFTQELLEIKGHPKHCKLPIFIDDLDRCLPDRQVSLLEAIHFLTASSAPVVFIVGINPALAENAVIAHYGTDKFDPKRYLDKLFHHRINLPALNPKAVNRLFERQMGRIVQTDQGQKTIRDCCARVLSPESVEVLIKSADQAFCVLDLRNPRIIRRVLDKFHLWSICLHEGDSIGIGADEVPILLGYMAICERWFEFRTVLQDADNEAKLLERFATIAKGTKPNHTGGRSVFSQLPTQQETPQFHDAVDRLGQLNKTPEMTGKVIVRIERAMSDAGL